MIRVRIQENESEDIFCMSTIGRHIKPNFTVAVNPDGNRRGVCYFKYYNSDLYQKATKVARINFRTSEKVHHRNDDGKEDWIISSKEKKVLCDFLDQPSKFGPGTNWEYALFSWNHEMGLLEEIFPEKYSTVFEAFLNGFFDTDENLKNPSFLKSDLIRPDYIQLEN